MRATRKIVVIPTLAIAGLLATSIGVLRSLRPIDPVTIDFRSNSAGGSATSMVVTPGQSVVVEINRGSLRFSQVEEVLTYNGELIVRFKPMSKEACSSLVGEICQQLQTAPHGLDRWESQAGIHPVYQLIENHSDQPYWIQIRPSYQRNRPGGVYFGVMRSGTAPD